MARNIYEFELPDGSTAEIEADDEAQARQGLESMQKMTPPKPQLPPQGLAGQAGSFLKERLMAGVEGAYGMTPIPEAKQLLEGAQGTERAAATAGLIGKTAAIPATVATAGPMALAKMGGLGATLGATGVQEAASRAGEAVANLYEPTTRSVALNAALRAPEELAGAAIEYAPSLLGAKLALKAPAKTPSPEMAAAKTLEEYGGSPPPSARAGSLATKTLGQAGDVLTRTNPVTDALISKPRDMANIKAVQSFVTEKFGADSLNPAKSAEHGVAIEGAIREARQRRTGAYGKIMAEIKPLNKASQSRHGSAVAKATAEWLKQNEAASNYVPDKLQADVAEFAQRVNGKPPAVVDMEIKRLNDNYKASLAGMDATVKNTRTTQLGQVSSAIKQAHYDGLDKLKKGLGTRLAKENGDYSEAAKTYGKVGTILGKNIEENYAARFLKGGAELAKGMKKELGPGYKLVQDAGANELIRQSVDSVGNLSLPLLQRNYNKAYRNADWRPEQRQAIETTIHMMKVSGINLLNEQNPSGTARTLGGTAHLVAAASPAHWPALAGETAALGLYNATPALGRALRADIPGTGHIPLNLPRALGVASQAGGQRWSDKWRE